MIDLLIFLLWAAVLAVALRAAVWARRRLGIGAHWIRDALHIGTGVWVLGWTAWTSPVLPLLMVAFALCGAAVVPYLARASSSGAGRLLESVVADQERWTGIVLYCASFAAFTALGLMVAPFPAAACLLALSLGDGIGGLVGRSVGRLGFTAPGGKRKTVEGTLAVAAAAAVGVLFASWWFGAGVGVGWVLSAGVIAAVAEALAPRATDNALLPVAVWTFLSAAPI